MLTCLVLQAWSQSLDPSTIFCHVLGLPTNVVNCKIFLFLFVGYTHGDGPIEGHLDDLTILLSQHLASSRLSAISHLM